MLLDRAGRLTDLVVGSTWTLCLVSMCLVLVVLRCLCAGRGGKPYRLPPGTAGWPLIGETIPFIVNGNKFMRDRISRYGPVFRTCLLGQHVVVVSGADKVCPVLLGEGSSVLAHPPPSVRTLIGGGTLSNTTGPHHHKLHRFVTKTFHLSNLQLIAPAVHQVIRAFVARWRQTGVVLSGVSEMKKLALTLGTSVLLGLDLSDDEMDKVIELFDTFNQAFFTFPIDLPGFAFHKGKCARRELVDLIKRQLSDVTRASSDTRLHLIHDLVLRHQQTSANNTDVRSVGDLINMTIELVFGSHESLASAFSSILMYLGHDPELYRKIRSELGDRHRHIAVDDVITFGDVMSARYVHHVVDEVLRLSPPIAGSFRKTIKPIQIASYDIPEGWTILYSIPSTHLLSPLFSHKRDELVPERWQDKENHMDENDNQMACSLADRLRSKARFHYIPFGRGPRRCVGKQFALLCLRVLVIEVVRTGRVRLVNGFPKIKTCPFVYPKDNLPLYFDSSE